LRVAEGPGMGPHFLDSQCDTGDVRMDTGAIAREMIGGGRDTMSYVVIRRVAVGV